MMMSHTIYRTVPVVFHPYYCVGHLMLGPTQTDEMGRM